MRLRPPLTRLTRVQGRAAAARKKYRKHTKPKTYCRTNQSEAAPSNASPTHRSDCRAPYLANNAVVVLLLPRLRALPGCSPRNIFAKIARHSLFKSRTISSLYAVTSATCPQINEERVNCRAKSSNEVNVEMWGHS